MIDAKQAAIATIRPGMTFGVGVGISVDGDCVVVTETGCAYLTYYAQVTCGIRRFPCIEALTSPPMFD